MKHGFTLIELMIAVAVIAIISAIAIPSYQSHITKSRRTDAITQLLQAQLKQEQIWLSEIPRKYTSDGDKLGFINNNYYKFTTSGTKNTYTLTATAQGTQAKQDATCTPLTINQNGDKTPANCW
ncbi:MAG: type IV pilin protein [Plesiomonas sp.]